LHGRIDAITQKGVCHCCQLEEMVSKASYLIVKDGLALDWLYANTSTLLNGRSRPSVNRKAEVGVHDPFP
jgi:hypothetical protein